MPHEISAGPYRTAPFDKISPSIVFSDVNGLPSPDPLSQAAIAYLRVSTHEQAVEGVSLDAQEQRVRSYCDAAGLDLVEVVRDEGVSAYSKSLGDRPGGLQVLERIDAGHVHHIIALKLDRLFRDAVDALSRTREWDHAGIALHLVDLGGQAINTGSAMGRFFLSVMAGFAELERNLISERTAVALRYKKAQGAVYGPEPFGRERDGESLIENKDELAVLCRMRSWHEQGVSLAEIARRLNETNVPTKRGKSWHASTVRYLLRNNLYSETGQLT